MQRYFIDQIVTSNTIELDETIMHHLNHVLRLRTPCEIVIVDASSNVFEVVVEPKNKYAKVLKQCEHVDDAPIKITLAMALLKKDKFEWVIQKACELGVSKIVPFLSERTIVDVSEAEFEKKRARYQMIAKEACEQSHRQSLCTIESLHQFTSLDQLEASFKGLCYERVEGESITLKHCVHQSTLIVVGPEGGFSEKEVQWAKTHEFHLITLGHKILRAETAAIAACAMIEAYHDQ
jgi:16S rRNA (uracil1498-N3)-methyltransferase